MKTEHTLLTRKDTSPSRWCLLQFVQWRMRHISPPSAHDVAASKRVEQGPPGKKNEIMPLDSAKARILLDSP